MTKQRGSRAAGRQHSKGRCDGTVKYVLVRDSRNYGTICAASRNSAAGSRLGSRYAAE